MNIQRLQHVYAHYMRPALGTARFIFDNITQNENIPRLLEEKKKKKKKHKSETYQEDSSSVSECIQQYSLDSPRQARSGRCEMQRVSVAEIIYERKHRRKYVFCLQKDRGNSMLLGQTTSGHKITANVFLEQTDFENSPCNSGRLRDFKTLYSYNMEYISYAILTTYRIIPTSRNNL